MRTLTLPLLMAALTATASEPGKMIVVVHTSDMVILNYVCFNNTVNEADNPVLGSCIKSTGGYNWHVTGGVAPYTIVTNEMRTMSGGCITVMDAEGTMATGCGVIGVQQERLAVNCSGTDQTLDDGTFGLVPNDSTDMARSAWKTEPGRKPVVERVPVDAYVPPVRTPLPSVDPPVDPGTSKTAKQLDRRTPSTTKGPNHPPPVNRNSVLPSSKSPEAGTGNAPKSMGVQPSRTPGNSAVQQQVQPSTKVH